MNKISRAAFMKNIFLFNTVHTPVVVYVGLVIIFYICIFKILNCVYKNVNHTTSCYQYCYLLLCKTL